MPRPYSALPRRREFLGMAAGLPLIAGQRAGQSRPNILFAISDDQTWLHAGAYGSKAVHTPAFDRVARMGVRFTQAICCSPGCAPSRAAILTGRPPWQLEEAGTHASYFPRKFAVYPDLLAQAGYHVGFTGKGAGPANFEGWPHNPAGPPYQTRKAEAPPGISNNDYAANFDDFLAQRPAGQPFAFWFGCQEPHREYLAGSGLKAGKKLADAQVPPFLPDTEEIRSDILDYYVEIEHFDRHLGRMLDRLEQAGELNNTLVAVTSDNGMPFPRAKATMYEYGIHMPLAIACPAMFRGGRTAGDLVSFTDFAPSFLEAAGLKPPPEMTGRSLMNVLASNKSGRVDPARTYALSGRERHSHARYDNLGYPARALRTHEFLYIRNFAPDRWPAGDPPGYHDIDASPSKAKLIELAETAQGRRYAAWTFGKQPAEQLYDIRKDPGCLNNLAEQPAFAARKKELAAKLETELRAQRDPRVLGNGAIWESYPRHSPMRPELGGFAGQGQYNPKYQQR